MPERPLLILPQPAAATRHRKPGGGGGRIHFPDFDRQRQRVLPQLHRLEDAFERQRAYLQRTMAGLEPELVLVLETVGRVEEFYKTVRQIEGLEWLGEWDEHAIAPEEEMFYDQTDREKRLLGRVYLVMFDEQGLRQLLSLWETYSNNPDRPGFARGKAKWRHLFKQLHDLRPWGTEDRLYETGLLEDVGLRAAAGAEAVRVEVELWYRTAAARGEVAEAAVRRAIDDSRGRVLARARIDEIQYHALLAELPLESAQAVVNMGETRLVHSEEVSFLRPVGQVAVSPAVGEPLGGEQPPATVPIPAGSPLIGLLDGLPLENHRWLAGRLIVDDPDGWAATYPPSQRMHGTEMASLVIHGDLDAPARPQSRPVYVRPILAPNPRDYHEPKCETVPEDLLPVDLVHRAIRRMFEGDGPRPPRAPTVKVINLSVCDGSRPFDRSITPWARLLDYLSWTYNVLFIVAAGNHAEDIELAAPRTDGALHGDGARLEAETLRALYKDTWKRRLLSPSESVNALTVAASHADATPVGASGVRMNVFTTPGLLSPINCVGPGYRRSVKPEVLFAGGRQLYRERPGNTHAYFTLVVDPSTVAPGLRVASPSRSAGDLTATRYTRGTSNAAAQCTGAAGRLYDVLAELRDEPGGERITDQFVPVVTKALLVHGARWGPAYDAVAGAVTSGPDRSHVTRLLGYGASDVRRVAECTENRATAIGCGMLGHDEAHRFILPLPPSLSGRDDWRRLVVTLAWFTPTHSAHRAYRKAQLFVSPYGGVREDDQWQLLGVGRREVDWRATRRGTLQHEVFDGDRAATFHDGDSLALQVNCSSETGGLDDEVPYGLVVTLEVAPGITNPRTNPRRCRRSGRTPLTGITVPRLRTYQVLRRSGRRATGSSGGPLTGSTHSAAASEAH
jgi:hypothetical protein